MGALGLNLVVALALLAPGFAAYLAVFSEVRTRVRAAAPAPNSAAALGVVIFGSLLAHALGAVLSELNDLVLMVFRRPLITWAEDPYALIVGLVRGSRSAFSLGEARWLLWCDLALCVATYPFARWLLQLGGLRTWVNGHLLGWAGRLPAQDAGVLVAYVLTDTEVSEAHVGYEGVLIDLTLTAEKAVASLLMTEVKLFHLIRVKGRLRRIENERDEPIPQLQMAGEHVRNIAFETITIPDAPKQEN